MNVYVRRKCITARLFFEEFPRFCLKKNPKSKETGSSQLYLKNAARVRQDMSVDTSCQHQIRISKKSGVQPLHWALARRKATAAATTRKRKNKNENKDKRNNIIIINNNNNKKPCPQVVPSARIAFTPWGLPGPMREPQARNQNTCKR